jgi:hypothetical protein
MCSEASHANSRSRIPWRATVNPSSFIGLMAVMCVIVDLQSTAVAYVGSTGSAGEPPEVEGRTTTRQAPGVAR